MDQLFILHGVNGVQLASIKMCHLTACDKLTTYSSLTAKKCTNFTITGWCQDLSVKTLGFEPFEETGGVDNENQVNIFS